MTIEADGAGGAAPHLMLRAARRRWQLVVAGAVAGLLVGAVVAVVLPHDHQATAKVVVNPVPSDSPSQSQNRTRSGPTVSMETEAQIARSSVVRELAAQKYLPSGTDPALLDNGLVVSVVPDSAVLRFDFTTKKSADATAAAQAYALAYLDNRASTARTFVDGVIRQLQANADLTQSQIARAKTARDKAAQGSSERARQQELINSLNQKLVQLETDLATRQNSQIQPGTEITKPTSAHQTGAKLPFLVLIGVILGTLIGLGAATLRERTDPRLREAGDVQDDLGVPLLAVLPPHDPDTVIDPDSAAADAYRQLRNEIFLGRNAPVVLAVTRVDASTGTGDVTANLAVLLARSGRRVCVIDTDTGPRRLETLLEGVDRVGLVHAGSDGDGIEAGIAVVTQREGVGQAKLGDVLASPLFARLVDATRSEAEVVLIDAPPVLSSAGQAVLSTADAALLVVTQRKTRRDDVLAADDRIRRSGSRLVGTAVRESERKGESAAPAPDQVHGPAELPPAAQTALPPAASTPSHVREGAGTVYQPDAPPAYRPQEPFAPESTQPPATVPDSVPSQPSEPAATPVAEPVPAALGWPDHNVIDGETVNGASSGLGWPESRRALRYDIDHQG